jgi:hypothetical protein
MLRRMRTTAVYRVEPSACFRALMAGMVVSLLGGQAIYVPFCPLGNA